ncbi:30S ribosomal protein S4 [Candidatus Falkowbacteria bacterium]|nr:30S ribosomal protein S4 [Candidatus Falkowbacteria bacterium]
MGRNLDPKCKQCRRAGEKLFLKGERCYSPKCAIVKRNYPPGVHGVKGGQRKSDYGLQLQEKQKVKKQYNLLEKQFKLTFTRAEKQPGNVGENFFKLLETRLDNAVYRAGFAKSREQARQLISHGHFTINNKKVNIPSYQLKIGDIVKIKESGKRSKHFRDLIESFKLRKIEAPGWLSVDIKELAVKVSYSPNQKDIKNININPQMIVEFYSR